MITIHGREYTQEPELRQGSCFGCAFFDELCVKYMAFDQGAICNANHVIYLEREDDATT